MQELKRTREETVAERDLSGLSDGGHIYPECSNCRAILMDLFVTRPHEPEVWKVQATCPFCNDRSFIIEVKGGFHPGGYGIIKDDDPDDDVPSTIRHDITIEGDVFVFIIKKASEHAQPVRR